MTMFYKGKYYEVKDILKLKHKEKNIDISEIIERLDEILEILKSIEKELKQNAGERTVTNNDIKETNTVK